MSQQAIDYIKKDATITLVAVNVAVFIAIKIGKLIAISTADGDMQWLAQLALSSDIHDLVSRPWCLLTYMFTQTDTLHLLFNALWLFCFGRLIGSIISYRNVIAVYLIGGICGGLIFVLLYETIARADGWLMGASASVIALAMSVAVVMPKRKIPLVLFGNVRVIWIISIVVLLIILGTSIDNLGGAIAHFGGLVSGLALGILIKRRYLCVTTIDTVNSELDILLNKVKQNGYSSLSSREQKRLFELSAKHNKK